MRRTNTAGERAAKRIKLLFANRPVDPASSSSASSSYAMSWSAAASAGDTVIWGDAGGRRTSQREGQDNEERAKRQRTEKTELEMEMVSVADVKDKRIINSRRTLDP